MSTSLKLAPRLKARVAKAAKAAGKSPHAFMVEAIEQQTAQAERRAEFVREALERDQEMASSGLGYAHEDVRAAMTAKLAGKKGPPLKLRSWRK